MEEEFLNETIVKDCEEAIVKVGSNGKFQKIIFVLLIICYTCTGSFITNAFIFLEKDPPITCYKINQDSTIESFACTRKEACDANSGIFRYEFNFIDNANYSWTNDFKLTCEDNYFVALFASLFFIGSMISSSVAPTLSDYLGRAGIIKYSMMLRMLFVFLPIVVQNIYLVLACMFCLGLLNSMHSTIPYILLSEYVSKDERDTYLTLMFMFESFSGIICTVFFYLLQNWVIFFILNLIYGCIFVAFSFLLYESPRFLYSNRRFKEAREVLKKISKINSGKEKIIKFEKELNMNDRDSVLSIATGDEINLKYLIMNPNYRTYILILPLIWLLDAFAFFAINFMIKYIKENIYFLNCIVFLSEAVSYLISNFTMNILGKRNAMMISFLISGISFILFFFLEKFDNLIITIILTFTAKFGSSVVLNISSIYTNESFPTHVRGRATAICSFLGKFGGIIAPFLVEMSPLTGLVSGVTSLVAVVLLIPLENRGKQTKFNDEREEESDSEGGVIGTNFLTDTSKRNLKIEPIYTLTS